MHSAHTVMEAIHAAQDAPLGARWLAMPIDQPLTHARAVVGLTRGPEGFVHTPIPAGPWRIATPIPTDTPGLLFLSYALHDPQGWSMANSVLVEGVLTRTDLGLLLGTLCMGEGGTFIPHPLGMIDLWNSPDLLSGRHLAWSAHHCWHWLQGLAWIDPANHHPTPAVHPPMPWRVLRERLLVCQNQGFGAAAAWARLQAALHVTRP